MDEVEKALSNFGNQVYALDHEGSVPTVLIVTNLNHNIIK